MSTVEQQLKNDLNFYCESLKSKKSFDECDSSDFLESEKCNPSTSSDFRDYEFLNSKKSSSPSTSSDSYDSESPILSKTDASIQPSISSINLHMEEPPTFLFIQNTLTLLGILLISIYASIILYTFYYLYWIIPVVRNSEAAEKLASDSTYNFQFFAVILIIQILFVYGSRQQKEWILLLNCIYVFEHAESESEEYETIRPLKVFEFFNFESFTTVIFCCFISNIWLKRNVPDNLDFWLTFVTVLLICILQLSIAFTSFRFFQKLKAYFNFIQRIKGEFAAEQKLKSELESKTIIQEKIIYINSMPQPPPEYSIV